MENIGLTYVEVLGPIGTSIVPLLTGGLGMWFGAFIKSRADKQASIENSRWQMKQSVFDQALKTVDGYWSNMEGWQFGPPDPQRKPEIEEVREVHNLLSLTCNTDEVMKAFNKCMKIVAHGEKSTPLRMDAIQDLRSAMRKELGFEVLILERNAAWLPNLH